MLIAVCGIDGSGKTTQIDMLAKKLGIENTSAITLTKQPTEWYRKDIRLRALLNEELEETDLLLRELALFAASDRLRHIQTEIIPSLDAGKVVISDRYVFSTFAYFLSRGLDDIEWLKLINQHAIQPDLTIFIDTPADVAVKRIIERDGNARKREELNLYKMNNVRKAFVEQPWGQIKNYHVFDGLLDINELHEQIYTKVQYQIKIKNRGI